MINEIKIEDVKINSIKIGKTNIEDTNEEEINKKEENDISHFEKAEIIRFVSETYGVDEKKIIIY